MSKAGWALALLTAAVATGGCGSDGEQGDPNDESTAGVGGGGGGITPPGPELEAEDVFGVTNFDDDDLNQQRDFDDPYLPGEDDISPIVLGPERLAELEPGTEIRLTLAGDTPLIRVFHDGVAVLGAETGATVYSLPYSGQAPVLEVEFGGYLARGGMLIEILDEDGVATDDTEITVMASPLILNHHLQALERAWVLRTNGNSAMRGDFTAVLNERFVATPGNRYGFDIWLQDEPQFATQVGNHGERQDVIIDSNRDRGLDPWPEDTAEAEFAVSAWGIPGQGTTYDSFGNLEVTPPVEVDGVSYPFGRIYYGRQGNEGMGPELSGFLASQQLQAPVEVDSTWLCVGHVDEFATFIPDPSSEKGFKLLMADTRSAYALVETLEASQPLPRYQQVHGVSTIGSLQDDEGLKALNNEIQLDELDPILDQFKAEFGLTDDDVILIPTIFEPCGAWAVALTPGMVNLIVANPEGATPTLIVPDPFFRGNGEPQESDPFLVAFRDAMPEGIEVVFTDNFFTYHANLGEVHCGTAVQRTPDEKSWWVEGQDILQLERSYFQ